jgi:hypothetical protein
MTAGPVPRRVDSIVGIYDADGGLLGELRYAARKVTGRGHCSLCDLTHRGVRRRADWQRACDRRSVPVELLHRNERPADVEALTGERIPCVLARVDGGLLTLLGPDDLDACEGDVDAFDRRLDRAVADYGLTLEVG